MFEATVTDLELDCETDDPPSEMPELFMDFPSLAHDPPSDLVYAPDLECSFTVHLLHQFWSESVCTCIAISGDERFFAVGGSRKIYVCSFKPGDEAMTLDVTVAGPVQEDPDDFVRDLSFTADSQFRIGATESGRIMVCCQASTSWLGTCIRWDI